MPITTATTGTAYAYCTDPHCPGSKQEEVKAVLTHVDVLYVDNGGTIPGVDHSHDYVVVADESEAPCPHCKTPRDVTTQARPVYRNESRQDPLELLKRQGEVIEKVTSLEHEREVEQLNRQIADRDQAALFQQMRDEIEALKAEVATKAAKPGRKPATD